MRASWDEYFMEIAQVVATRATCDRKHVGAVVVRDKNIIATGYNGSIPGTEHCDDVGHLMAFDPNTQRESCIRTVHAEANAVSQAAKHNGGSDGATIYVTASPCWTCFRYIASSGIKRIVFGELYFDERIWKFAKDAKIELVDLTKSRAEPQGPFKIVVICEGEDLDVHVNPGAPRQDVLSLALKQKGYDLSKTQYHGLAWHLRNERGERLDLAAPVLKEDNGIRWLITPTIGYGG